MINFVIGMYRNPKPGSMCWIAKVHRWEPCLSGDTRYIVSSFLLLCAVVTVTLLAGLVIGVIKS